MQRGLEMSELSETIDKMISKDVPRDSKRYLEITKSLTKIYKNQGEAIVRCVTCKQITRLVNLNESRIQYLKQHKTNDFVFPHKLRKCCDNSEGFYLLEVKQ